MLSVTEKYDSIHHAALIFFCQSQKCKVSKASYHSYLLFLSDSVLIVFCKE